MNANSAAPLLIVNPISGRGAALRSLPSIRRLLDVITIRSSVAVSNQPGAATRLTSDAIRAGHRTLIAVGGDGTVNEVVNGIFAQTEVPPREVTLAVIPQGTGNDWVRTLGVPREMRAAVRLIGRGQTLFHDVGVVELGSGAHTVVRHFVNVSGVGFDAHVAQRLSARALGAFAYPIGVLRALRSYRALPLRLEWSDRTVVDDVFELVVANGRFLGGGMQIAPQAVSDDGLLDVMLVRGAARWGIVKDLRRLFDGSLHTSSVVESFRTASLRVVSDQAISVQTDGEIVCGTPITFRVIPRALRVIAPPSSRVAPREPDRGHRR